MLGYSGLDHVATRRLLDNEAMKPLPGLDFDVALYDLDSVQGRAPDDARRTSIRDRVLALPDENQWTYFGFLACTATNKIEALCVHEQIWALFSDARREQMGQRRWNALCVSGLEVAFALCKFDVPDKVDALLKAILSAAASTGDVLLEARAHIIHAGSSYYVHDS